MVDNRADQSAAEYSASAIAERLREILHMLDHSNVTPDIGAHVDLALCRLQEQMACNGNDERELPGLETRQSFS